VIGGFERAKCLIEQTVKPCKAACVEAQRRRLGPRWSNTVAYGYVGYSRGGVQGKLRGGIERGTNAGMRTQICSALPPDRRSIPEPTDQQSG